MPGTYRLERVVPDVVVPDLDDAQQRVVDHADGPLLVLAGPGTGKTTTLVEAVVRRFERAESAAAPLVLTFSRKAAVDLRARITARLGRSVTTPTVLTFHAFCFALVRRFGDEEAYGTGVRLLTAPEQEFRVRETLAGTLDGADDWPESVRAAYETRAFAGEVRGVLARARQLGMDPEDLAEVADEAGRPEWQGVARFMDEYLKVLDWEQALDYAELVHRSRILLTDPEVLDAVRREIDGVFVDEYQDTDPSQVALLRTVVGPGGHCVVVGDPDQSIYGFRGAEARGITDFCDRFRTGAGEPAPVVALGRTRRFGKAIAAATRQVCDRLPLAGAVPAAVREAFRAPVVDPAAPRGRVEVLTCDSPGAEAEHIADLLRQAHLHDGVAWADMAVLVRSGRRVLPGLSRALIAAGVPIEVAGDEIALSAELAVRPLLLALEIVARGRVCDADEAARLLQSPLGGLDSLGLRRLGRDLREAERRELGGAMPPLSDELVARALADPGRIDDAVVALERTSPELEKARTLAGLLLAIEERVHGSATAEEALWALWSGTEWPERLRSAAARGGDAAQRADRDLDAVCALFDVAARSEELVGLRGLSGFLAEVEAQQIPADTQREADVRGRGVRLMTAHRSKGLEFRLVVVASVQEGMWPDLRTRGSLLEADRLGSSGGRWGITLPPPTSARVAEERRLFYVACTRARERLVVTAVEGTEGEGDQPSRFCAELGVRPVHLAGRPTRPLTLGALVGELRRVSVDPDQPPVLRDAAAIRLARLADAVDDDGRPVAPSADPRRWWGMEAVTEVDGPVVPADEPIRISGSTLGALVTCPRQWFLSRRASAESGRSSAASAGEVMHVLIDHAEREGIDATDLADHLDHVWDRIDFDAAYLSAVERAEAEGVLERFVAWQDANAHREVLGSEVSFEVPLEVAGDHVVLHGTVDRLERLPDGRLHVVDFKTGRKPADKKDVPTHDQLGVYQLAAAAGAFDHLAPGERRVGGAELVYLRVQDKVDLPYPVVLPQASIDDVPVVATGGEGSGGEGDGEGEAEVVGPTWVHDKLARACRTVRTEQFDARAGAACQWCAFAGSCPARAEGGTVVP
ncbi:ATP-dependent helicase [Mariniluteicoccus flavus]